MPELARVFAALYTHIVTEQRPACALVLGNVGLVKFSDSGLVLVVGAAVVDTQF